MVNDHQPLVSVIIPVFNCEKYIKESIDSVLQQTYPNYEIIVVDDGSNDDTAAIVQQLPVRYFYQKNQGQPAAVNFGISQAKGELLAFNDADDLWSEDKLEKQVSTIKANPELDAVFGLVQQFISPELSEEARRRIHCPKEPMKGYGKLTMLIKKASFQAIGSFNTKVKIGDFIDWFAMAKRQNIKTELVDQVFGFRRLHTDNMSVQNTEERKSFAEILKRHLDAQKK